MVDDGEQFDQNSSFPESHKVGVNRSKQRRGILSRIWNGMFRAREDFEKKLQHLSKEEAAVQNRINKRGRSWRRAATNIIYLSVVLEVVAVVYAVITTRTLGLNWKMRAVRVLPMFVVPFLSFAIYSTLSNFTRMRNHKDQKTLEKLRAERQAKIHELKERTNYYTTQQLIQKYDDDPAEKAAAASVLAHKLGVESGVKVYVAHELEANQPSGKSSDVQVALSSALRNRKQGPSGASSGGSFVMAENSDQTKDECELEHDVAASKPVVGHFKQPSHSGGGWIARLAALLVGEDPTQCFALICGNCLMHNGLARKEDFPYIRYYCPHCHALNGPSQQDESTCVSGSSSIKVSPRPSSVDSDAPVRPVSLLESELTSVSKLVPEDHS